MLKDISHPSAVQMKGFVPSGMCSSAMWERSLWCLLKRSPQSSHYEGTGISDPTFPKHRVQPSLGTHLVEIFIFLVHKLYVSLEVLTCPEALATTLLIARQRLFAVALVGTEMCSEMCLSQIGRIAPLECTPERSVSSVRAHVLSQSDRLCVRL